MTLLLHTLACGLFGGPRAALNEGWNALVAGDLEAFEAVVELETVVPQAVEGCVRVSMLPEWAEREKRPPNALRGLGQALGRGLLSGVVEAGAEELVADARTDFGTKRPDELCPAIQPGDPERATVERNGDLATARLPIVAYDTETWLVADMRRTEAGWKVTSLDFEPAIVELKQALLAAPTPPG